VICEVKLAGCTQHSAKSQVSGLPKTFLKQFASASKYIALKLPPKCNISEGLKCMLKRVVSALVFNHLKCPVPGTILAFQKLQLKSYISGAVYCYII
jgi:hypothetical protein